MLDENLPTFHLKKSPTVDHHAAFYLTHRGSEPEAAYNLQKLDPSLQTAKNCYAAALYDPHNPEVLFGEVLLRPQWSQPSPSQDDIRRLGGVPPSPQPIHPHEFTVQLYNPDQQVVVRQKSKSGSWHGAPSYQFSMPQHTFRLPSASSLDRQLSDPAASVATPQINFTWRRDGLRSKDLACSMTGKSTDLVKKKHKEPDILVAMFQGLRELTLYESNYHRIDVEDSKGLEVVLLLSAAVLKEVYLAPPKDAYNIADEGLPSDRRSSSPGLSIRPRQTSQPAPADPSSEWEIDAETARLKAELDAEQARLATLVDAETARLKAEQNAEQARLAARRREQEKADAAEAKRLAKQLEAEQKERKRKQAEVDRETERLRKLYGSQDRDTAWTTESEED